MASRHIRASAGWWGAFSLLLLTGIGLALGEALRVARTPPPPHLVSSTSELAVDDPEFERTLDLLTGTHVEGGNRVEPLLNGDGTYPRLWRDLRSASRTITTQMYYARPGRVADTLAAILCERARAGVRVLFLLDAFGAKMSDRWLTQLRACGVEASLLRPLKWYTLHSATDRSHVRVVVVDGRVAYTGGFGLADYWLGAGHDIDQWRETNVRFEGPAVAGLQAAFAAAWAEATGELIVGEPFFAATLRAPIEDASTTVRASVLFTAPTAGNTAAERFLALAIRSARKRLYITNSYFVPNRAYRGLLEGAAARGVDVRVLTAGPRTDVKTPRLAGRYRYDELVASGIRIYEYQPVMVHAKAIVVDDYWTTIGSMNFDNRSLGHNDESNLVILDRGIGAAMDSVFADDLRYSLEMTPAQLAKRSWWDRCLERGAVMLARML